MKVAKIKNGEIVNVELWDKVPKSKDGFTYNKLSTVLANNLPYKARAVDPRVVIRKSARTKLRAHYSTIGLTGPEIAAVLP